MGDLRARKLALIALGAVIITGLAAAAPALMHRRRLPPLHPLVAKSVELVAAYEPIPGAVVMAGDPKSIEWIDFHGRRLQIDRADRLGFLPEAVDGVRFWEVPRLGVSIALGRELRARLSARSNNRMSQLDALLVDGVPCSVALYESVVSHELPIMERDQSESARDDALLLFEKLAGTIPP
jgi:hypothetical protein